MSECLQRLTYDAFIAACSVLVSSTFAFLLALFTAYLLNMTVNPVTLSEALPFLVVVVGFEKPFILARSVFANPAFDPREPLSTSRPDIFETLASGSSAHDRRSVNSSTGGFDEQHTFPVAPPRERVAMKPARDIVVHAVNRHGMQLLRGYVVEIAVLLLGAVSGVSGLTEFCQLAALILAFDCAFLFVFYVAILTVMVEVRSLSAFVIRLRLMSDDRFTVFVECVACDELIPAPIWQRSWTMALHRNRPLISPT